MYVGRLSIEKGVMDLLHAWETIDRRAVLVLVGPDMPENPLDAGPAARRYAADHGLTNVIFHGRRRTSRRCCARPTSRFNRRITKPSATP